ncbi:hypothetical protein V6N11_066978 [Hibiscus sabdariffa]|uniref:Phospholipase D C-terminal domain-containing protein n=1 Tax=Hibiscus sabdariffa TaxID=183260 RepID=A0ABR2SPS4_9ROSI
MANEGVTVLILVWDDGTSVEEFKKNGLIATHDQETADYFKGTKVNFVLCPRNPGDGKSIIQGFETASMFTHHQKIVVTDGELPGGSPASGQSLVLSVKVQLLGTCCTISSSYGQMQVGTNGLIPRNKIEEIVNHPTLFTSLNDPETWNVQLFRSIDGGAAAGFPQAPDQAAELGLISRKDVTIDQSIQDDYINAIQRAKSFIYIENEYFLGSSFGWISQDIKVKDIGALHLIPKELSLKFVSKTEAGERFTVYIVIPMWPEGIPESRSVQAILDWHRDSMQIPGTISHFSALETRRPKRLENMYLLKNQNLIRITLERNRHDVDDEYIIIGSANINQRSMDGGRDSEIAMEAFQPHHIATDQKRDKGQIRIALWQEHLGLLDSSFQYPESLQCVNTVNSTADELWNMYSSETVGRDLPGHLPRHPIEINRIGGITALPNMELFPDTKARVLGTKAECLPVEKCLTFSKPFSKEENVETSWVGDDIICEKLSEFCFSLCNY